MKMAQKAPRLDTEELLLVLQINTAEKIPFLNRDFHLGLGRLIGDADEILVESFSGEFPF